MPETDIGFSARVDVRAVLPGYEWIIQRRDATAVVGWAATEERAWKGAAEYLENNVV